MAVDSSSAVPKENWLKIKSFMKSIVDAFLISKPATHVGILSFSSVPYLETRFLEELSKSNISQLLDNMQQLLGKQRRIDKALRMANSEFFSLKSRGFRPHKSKVFLLITGGNPTEGTKDVASAVNLLTQNGVSVMAVGVGPGVDNALLQSMMEKKENYFKIADYNKLGTYVSDVVKAICKGESTLLLC